MDKNKLRQELAKALKSEMSGTGTGASVTAGDGAGVATKYAFGKRDNKGTPSDWKAAPSIPNRKSKAMDYKELWEDKTLDSTFNANKVWAFIESKPFYNKEYMPKFSTAEEIWNEFGPEDKEKYANFIWTDTYGDNIHPREKSALQRRANYDKLAGVKEIDANDPVLMKVRAAAYQKSQPKSEPVKTINPDYKAIKNADKIKALLRQRNQLMMDMEQEAEPEGGPIANRYGGMLNKIDRAITMLKGQGENNPYMDKGEIERRASIMNETSDNSTDEILTYLQAAKQNSTLSPDAQEVFLQWMNTPGASREEIIKVLRKLTGMYLKEGYKVDDIIHFKDGEDWIVMKVKDKVNKLVIKPHNEKAKENNISLEIDIDMDDVNKNLNEGYARFRNESKTRTKPEQFHSAVKQVKQKVNEINRLFEYMNRLQSELSESEGGLKYKKYTEKSIQQIKESTKSLFFKSTKLK